MTSLVLDGSESTVSR